MTEGHFECRRKKGFLGVKSVVTVEHDRIRIQSRLRESLAGSDWKPMNSRSEQGTSTVGFGFLVSAGIRW
jgi:hypothetical protein